MRSFSLGPVAGLVLALTAGLGYSQNKTNKEDISFETFDGVMIKGTFYPSTKANAPVVMFVHKFGLDRTKGGWDDLATHLQEKGYNVMSFDFRGHGGSTNVKPDRFWSYPPNRNLINRYTKDKKTISFKDFRAGYLPMLVNDIAAARYDLDNRNDNGQCNTSNIIVIAAEDGGPVAFTWMAYEHTRAAIYSRNPFQPGNGTPASDDIAGAIWLSFVKTPQVNGSHMSFPYGSLTGVARTMRDNIPMWFAVGNDDKDGKADTDYLYNSVLRADQAKKQLELTFKKPIANTKLRGAQLLSNEKLSTNEDIDKYLKKLVEKRPNTAQKKRNASEMPLMPVPLGQLGFSNFSP